MQMEELCIYLTYECNLRSTFCASDYVTSGASEMLRVTGLRRLLPLYNEVTVPIYTLALILSNSVVAAISHK